MEQKRVSFKVAETIKNARYPQCGDWWYSENGGLSDDWILEMKYCAAPTYIEVWLWLWQNKNIRIDINATITDGAGASIMINDSGEVIKYIDSKYPEEAISDAIDYLVDNNLIK